MAAVLALVAALFNGSADFFGGLASRRARIAVVAVVAWSQAIGLVAALVIAAIQGAPVAANDLYWGMAAGVAMAVAVLALYRGFKIGRVGLVSPVAAVGSATIPIAWSLIEGERPSLLALAGLTLGLVAISQVASSQRGALEAGRPAAAGLREGLVAGTCFGIAFIALAEVGDDAGLWPVAAARGAAVVLMGAIVLASAGPRIPGRGSVPALVACGVLAVLGQASYIAATHHGLLSVVVVLASLYPVATVSLAWVIEHERLTHRQLFGLGLAIVAVALIASS